MGRLHDAVDALVERGPAFAPWVDRFGPPALRRRPPVDGRFEAIARAIAHQQLAGSAASAIWGRVVDACDDVVSAESVTAVGRVRLRAAGLSGAKAAALGDLAAHVTAGTVDLASLGRSSDDEVVEVLTRVRGIGPWTAQMFLINALHRLDVWPVGDLGVRVGWRVIADLDDVPSPDALDAAGEPLRPYRTLAAWYCWRAADSRRGS